MFNSNILIYVGAIALIVIVAAIYILSAFAPKPKWKDEVVAKINEINRVGGSTNEPMILSSLLIEADKLLDHTMKMRGIRGETMGDRLKNAKSYYDKNAYNNIWEAHKIRNRIAHEQNFQVKPADAKNQIGALLRGTRKLLS